MRKQLVTQEVRMFGRYATLAIVLASAFALPARAADDPCADYRRTLAYSRTANPDPVTLTMTEPQTGTEVEFRIARNFTALQGNLSDGAQCGIGFELMWPQMRAGGLVPDKDKQVRDRMIGDMPAWRLLTIDVRVERSPWASWMVPAGYCGESVRRAELADRPFGLRAFDDEIRWPRQRQADGSYRDMQELMSYPLTVANQFYYVDDDNTGRMTRISCSKGAPRCQLHGHFAGFQTVTFFNGEDIANWRDYRDAVQTFLAAHLIRSGPANIPLDPGLHGNPPPALVACMRGMAAKGHIDPATMKRMGMDR
jgi:hypothetical protein